MNILHPSRYPEVEVPTEKIGVAGRFKLVAHKLDGTSRVLADWFPNLITDQGLNRMGVGGPWYQYSHVGTGTATPATSDTALQTFLASTSTVPTIVTGTAASSPYYGYERRTYRFGIGVAAGNLTEVGVAYQGTTGGIFSRALIVDGGGSPTTITVLSDEVLDVIYEIRCYAPLTDATFSRTISGTSYSFTRRAMLVTTAINWRPRVALTVAGWDINDSSTANFWRVYDGTLGVITSNPSGASDGIAGLGAGGIVNGSYSTGTFYQNITAKWDLDNGNLAGGVSAIGSFTNIGSFQYSVTPDMIKDNTKILTLNTRVSWARR